MKMQINLLKQKVAELESQLTNVGMPYSLKEIIRNEVILQEDSVTATTQLVVTPTAGDDITLPRYYTSYLVFQWRGKQYKIPYI